MKVSTKILIGIWTPILLGAIAFFGYCAAGSIKDRHNPNAWKIQSNHSAVYMAEEFVRKELKYPSSAVFCEYKDCEVVFDETEQVYLVKGTLESKNSLGLYVPMTYYIEVQRVSERDWQLLEIKVRNK